MATEWGLNCSDTQRNIGLEACIVDYGQKTGHIQVPKGWSLELSSETFNKAYVNEQIQQGVFKVIGGAFGVTTETAEDTTQTSSLNKISVVTLGLPVVTTMIQKGYEFHAGYYTNSGQDKYDVIEVFSTGVLRAAVSTDGLTLTGLSTGMYQISSYQDNNGTNAAQTMVKYQLTDLLQYNTRAVPLTGLDFDANSELYNIVDVTMVGRADASENKVYVTTKWARNIGQNISSFAAANFKLYVNGVADTIVGSVTQNATTKEWAITPTATLDTNDNVDVYLYDATASPNVAVAKVGTTSPKFYAGSSLDITPVA